MNSWSEMELGKAIQFNPPERIAKGKIAKKIPMDRLTAYHKKIDGFEYAEYIAGPKFRNGDTLVAKITPCLENGKTAQVDILEPNEVAFGSSEFIVLRENEHSINDFIFYLAKSPAFRKKAIGCMEGTSGRKRVNEGALKLQVLPIPNRTTQQKIASVLSFLDSKIELNNRIIAELEAMAKTLYDYWFVQFDFPDASGKPYKTSGGKMVWNEELKQETPEGWMSLKMSQLYDFQYGTGNVNPDNGGEFPVYGSNGVIGWYDKFNSEDSPVIGHIGANCGSLIFANGKHYVTYNGVICRIKQGFNKYFGYSVLLSKDLKSNTRGSSQPFISYDLLDNLDVVIPEDRTMKVFCGLLDPLFDNVINLKKQNLQLSEIRDWLLPLLMNGQVKVKEAEVQVEELMMAAEPEMEYRAKK